MKLPLGLTTVVGKKIIMAVTGLAMVVFLIGHLVGNLQLFWNLGQFNAYAHFLTAQPVVILIELGLLAILLIHVIDALVLIKGNSDARPVPYHSKTWARTKSNRSRKTWSSTFMMWSGSAILVFIALHVWHFKYHHPITSAGQKTVAPHISNVLVGAGTGTPIESENSEEAFKLADLVVTEFQNPIVALIYITAMFLLGMHLYHAISSALTSLGASHPRYVRPILIGGRLLTILLAGGFAAIPLFVLLGFIKLPPENVAHSTPNFSMRSGEGDAR